MDTNATHLNPEEPWHDGAIAATQLLSEHPELTACVGIGNGLTLGIYKAAKTMRLKLPDDLSIIGMGADMLAFSVTEPSITIVDMGLENICRHAALQLRRLIDPKGPTAQRISQIMPRLHERQSVKRLNV